MFKKIIHFIKYNNVMVLIIAVVFIIGTGAFAQTEAGQAIIGQKDTRIEGVDNTLLLSADLENMNMDFKIEKVEQDEKYYYITYTFLDLVKDQQVWEYQMLEKVRKISKKLKQDLGAYLAEELAEQYEARVKELKKEQEKAEEAGEQKRIEITEYSGLIGRTLALADRIFPGYEPVKKQEMPPPDTAIMPKRADEINTGDKQENESAADSLTDIYNDYMARNDPDLDDVFGVLDNCPDVYNPEQEDADNDGIGDVCDDFFTLTPVIEEEATGTPEDVATTSESSYDSEIDIETATSSESSPEEATDGEEVATSSAAEADEEPEVEIIDLPAID